MLSIPRFHVNKSELSYVVDGPELGFYITAGSAEPIELNPGAALLALLADGERTLGDIFDSAIELGADIEDPAEVILLFRLLDHNGAVDMEWHLESIGPIRHACIGCGHSCEGHLIGLSPGETARVKEMKQSLETLEPSLGSADAVAVFDGDVDPPVTGLNTTSGKCVFLLDDHLCAIHKHFGLKQKPVACRLFPLRVINTEDGFRVGITGRCMAAHRSFQTAPALSPAEAIKATHMRRPPGDIVGLDFNEIRSMRNTKTFRQNAEQEAYFLSLATVPDLSFADILASSVGSPRNWTSPPRPFLRDVARRIRLFADRFEPTPLDRAGTSYGDASRSLQADFAELNEEPPDWREPEEPALAFLRETLQQFIYLRDTVRFPDVAVGVHVILIGLVAALWTAETWVADDAVADDLGFRVALWLRMNNVQAAHRFLFEDHVDYHRYIALLRGE